MWDLLADGVTQKQLLAFLLKRDPTKNFRIVWKDKTGLIFMYTIEGLLDMPGCKLEEADDFTIWMMT